MTGLPVPDEEPLFGSETSQAASDSLGHRTAPWHCTQKVV